MSLSECMVRLGQRGISTELDDGEEDYFKVNFEESVNSKFDTRNTVLAQVRKEVESLGLYFFELNEKWGVVSIYPEDDARARFDL